LNKNFCFNKSENLDFQTVFLLPFFTLFFLAMQISIPVTYLNLLHIAIFLNKEYYHDPGGIMLKEWTHNYLKNKDILHKRISTITDKGDYILVENKDETHIIVIVKEKMVDVDKVLDLFKKYQKKHKAQKLTLVLNNNKKNLDLLIKSWKKFVEFTSLTVIFANPEMNDKWIVSPAIHDRIADKKNLKQGLVSMFQTVESC